MNRRVLVCGGRNYVNGLALWRKLDELHKADPFTCVIEGGASGADSFARSWARQRGVVCITERANWAKHGRAAGAIRNARMLNEHHPDLVVAFPGGPGTANMMLLAREAGVPVLEVGFDDAK